MKNKANIIFSRNWQLIITIICCSGFFLPQPVLFAIICLLFFVRYLTDNRLLSTIRVDALLIVNVLFCFYLFSIGFFTNSTALGYYRSALTLLWIPFLSYSSMTGFTVNNITFSTTIFIGYLSTALFYIYTGGGAVGFSLSSISRGVTDTGGENSLLYTAPVLLYIVLSSKIWKGVFKLVLACLAIVAVYFSMKRAAYLSAILLFPIFIYRHFLFTIVRRVGFLKSALLVGVFSMIILGSLNFICNWAIENGISTMGRIDIWASVLKQPLSLDASRIGTQAVSSLIVPHNEFLRLYVDWGPFGCFLFFSMISYLFFINYGGQGIVVLAGVSILAMTSQPFLYWGAGWFQIIVLLNGDRAIRNAYTTKEISGFLS